MNKTTNPTNKEVVTLMALLLAIVFAVAVSISKSVPEAAADYEGSASSSEVTHEELAIDDGFGGRQCVFHYLDDLPDHYDQLVYATAVEVDGDVRLLYVAPSGFRHYFASSRIADYGVQVDEVIPIYVEFVD